MDSPSKAVGYWNQPERSVATFQARVQGDPGLWLRTGDLGKMVDGELVVCGRIKEIIIVRGKKYHPEDIEAVAQQASAQIRPGMSISVLGLLLVNSEFRRFPSSAFKNVDASTSSVNLMTTLSPG